MISHGIGLERLTASEVREMLALLRGIERHLVELLTARARRAAMFPTDPGPATTRALTRALVEVRQLLQRHSPVLLEHLEPRLRRLAEDEAEFIRERIRQAIPVQIRPFVEIHSVRPEVLHAIVTSEPFQGVLLATWFGDGPKSFAASVQKQLQREIRRSVALGLPPMQMVRRLERAGVKLPRRTLELITRTASMHVLGAAHDKILEVNSGRDGVVKAVQWLSTLDLSTTLEWCVPRDGKQYTVPDHRPIGHKYPWLAGPSRLHIRCRSKSTPVLKSFAELGIPRREVMRRQRASMDGRVARETTAEDWLKRQLSSTKRDQTIRVRIPKKDGSGFYTRLKRVSRREKLEHLYGIARMEAWVRGEITLDEMVMPRAGRLVKIKRLGLKPGRAA